MINNNKHTEKSYIDSELQMDSDLYSKDYDEAIHDRFNEEYEDDSDEDEATKYDY